LSIDMYRIILYSVFVFEPAIPDAPSSLRDAESQGQGWREVDWLSGILDAQTRWKRI